MLTRARCQAEAASRGGSQPHGGTSLLVLVLVVLGSPGGRSHDDSSNNGCQKQTEKIKESVASSQPHDMVLLRLGVVVVAEVEVGGSGTRSLACVCVRECVYLARV